jgi:hypothetical protein
VFDTEEVLDVAVRRLDGSTVIDPAFLTRRAAPPLPVWPALRTLLPNGLPRGSTITASGSVSLLLALLGAASAEGAWCALVGGFRISAEAAGEYGIELTRLAVVPAPEAQWATAVGALIDAVDVVVARVPARVTNGDIRRLAARARSHDTVLVPFVTGQTVWPGADLRLDAQDGVWAGIGRGYGRLRQRRLAVTVSGRRSAGRPRSATLWLPAAGGGVDVAPPAVEVLVPAGGYPTDTYPAGIYPADAYQADAG